MPRSVRAPVLAAAVAVAASVLAGCAEPRPHGSREARQKAGELVAATQEAGVAPRLTVDVAVSLYGVEAPAVCAAFRGGTLSSAGLIVQGNLAQGRRKTITDDAVTYARLVVQTYCPEVLANFDEAVQSLDPVDT